MKYRRVVHRSVSSIALLVLAAACGGGGGGGGGAGGGVGAGQPPVALPAGIPAPPYTSGLLALAAGDASVRVDWKLPGAGFESALFQGSDAGTLLAGAPIYVDASANPAVADGTTAGTGSPLHSALT